MAKEKAKPKSDKPPREKKDKVLKATIKDRTDKALNHSLVPEHYKLSEKDKEELLKAFSITMKELPKIFINDPAIRHLDVKENDVIKVLRKSPTAGETVFYRGVIHE